MIRKINEILSYALFAIGATQIIILILAILNIGLANSLDGIIYDVIKPLLSLTVIISSTASIIMIFLNIKEAPGVIPGYLLGLLALVIDSIVPSLFKIFVFLPLCGMFMKAGTIVKNNNSGQPAVKKTSKKIIKDTDWFFNDK